MVSVTRMTSALSRHPKLLERLFTPEERASVGEGPNAPAQWAARFAAKESVVKALGGWHGAGWQDIEVIRQPDAGPSLRLHGNLERWTLQKKLQVWVSISHEREHAVAMAVAEQEAP